MILQFAIAAQSVAVDRFSNRLSIFNVCERIEAPAFPIVIPELVFIVVLRREPSEPAVFDPVMNLRIGQMTVAQANLHVDFENSMMNRQIATFQGLPILSAGELEFSFNLPNGDPVKATVPIVQSQTTTPQAVHLPTPAQRE